MKKIISLFMIGLIVLNILSGCNSTVNADPQPSATGGQASTATPDQSGAIAQPSAGQEYASQIIVARAEECTLLDPVLVSSNKDTMIVNLLFENLWTWSDNGRDNINVCVDTYSVSDDGLTWTIKLRDDIYFSNGEKATADDWVFSLTRARDTEENQFRSNLAMIQNIQAPDDNTLVITVDQPQAVLESCLSVDSTFLTSRKYFEEVGEEGFAKKPLGTNLFYVKEWVEGEYILLGVNPYHRNAANMKFDELKILCVPDENTRTMMLMNGEIDIAWDVSRSAMQIMEAAPGITPRSDVALQMRYLMFNCTQSPTDDIRVREALRYATDLQEIVDLTLYGYGQPAPSFFASGQTGFNDDLKVVQQDIAKAKQLLAEAGYPNGLTVEFWVRADNPEYESIATILKQQWAEAGITANLTTLDTALILEKQYAVEQPIVIGRWSEGMNDPQGMIDYFWNYEDTRAYFTGLNNEEAQDLVAKCAVEQDHEKRIEMLERLQEIFYEEIPGIPLYYCDWTYATRDNVDGLIVTPQGSWRFHETYKLK